LKSESRFSRVFQSQHFNPTDKKKEFRVIFFLDVFSTIVGVVVVVAKAAAKVKYIVRLVLNESRSIQFALPII
jgi:hypothetical protein